ncbi:hypothetical protein FB451DRAFT_312655 [Mycena latifolia]|nr:hypothetical protein FB451DRAFT_312655 [Mycena latifolia]
MSCRLLPSRRSLPQKCPAHRKTLSAGFPRSKTGCKSEDMDEHWATGFLGPSKLHGHVCPRCNKAFTTTGHLKRHFRIHMGDKHSCPFPGCETRCSRKDNLQQHYKTHLYPRTRCRFSKSSMTSVSSARQTFGSASTSISGFGGAQFTSSPPAMDSPPALSDSSSQSSGYSSHSGFSSPPNTPPELVPAIALPLSDVRISLTASTMPSPHPYSSFCPERPIVPLINRTEPSGIDRHPSRRAQAHCSPRADATSSALPSPPGLSLAHPIPRISYLRSSLLDLDANYDAYDDQPSSSCEQVLSCLSESQLYLQEDPTQAVVAWRRSPLLEPLEIQDAIRGFDDAELSDWLLSYHLASSQHQRGGVPCQPYYPPFNAESPVRYPAFAEGYLN